MKQIIRGVQGGSHPPCKKTMLRFAANLSMMFTEWAFLDRFAAAADAGFQAVEFLFPYEHDPAEIGARLQRHGLTQALFNLPPGDWAAGERGLAALPGREADFRASVATALRYIPATGVKTLHAMSGLGNRHHPASVECYRNNLRHAVEALTPFGVTLVIEPINGRDMPGYFLNDFAFAAQIITELGAPNLGLQFDIYHRQILHGDITRGLETLMPLIRHIQIASVPSRHEPIGEELDFPFLCATLNRLVYTGFIGCEYRPRAGTLNGLNWFQRP